MPRTITATRAAKHLKDVLNAVERDGESFAVQRRGRLVAHITPAGSSAPRRVTLREALTALLDGPRPDPAFAADLDEIRRASRETSLPDDAWERWSTPRS